MNNPFTAYSKANLDGHVIQSYRAMALRQESLQIPEDGMCGSVIWKSDGKAVGFFFFFFFFQIRPNPVLGCFFDWYTAILAGN